MRTMHILHDICHSYASRALALRESLPIIGRLLGHAGRDHGTLCASGVGLGAGTGDAGFGENRGRHPARLTARTIAAVSLPEVCVFPEVLATNGGALGHGEEENSERSLKVRGDSMHGSTECLTASIGSDCPAHCDWSMVNR